MLPPRRPPSTPYPPHRSTAIYHQVGRGHAANVVFQTFVLSVLSRCCKSRSGMLAYVAMTKYACCKTVFQVFQVFQTYAANVLSECFKSKSWYCTRCNGYTRMFQVLVSSVCFKYFICFRCMLQMFHLDATKVNLALHMLLWLYTHVSSVLDICCKCFIWMFQKYISGEHMLQ
jgi:hypothetical protein